MTYSALRTPHSAWRGGQSTLEAALAMAGALLLLLAAVKITFWSTKRFYTRLQNYDRTRPAAGKMPLGDDPTGTRWRNNPYEPTEKLDILGASN